MGAASPKQQTRRRMRNLAEISRELDVESAGAELADITPSHITEDSRDVRPGAIFIARPGTRHDGRRFIAAAINAGAAAVLTDRTVDPQSLEAVRTGAIALLRTTDVPSAGAHLAEAFFDHPARDLTLIGVTGTNAKTTITHLVRSALDRLGIPCGLIGTVAIHDGVEATPASLTTPSAIDVSRALARMRENGCRAAAIEVSSHALDQGRVAALDFDVAVFTNLTGDHLDYHRTMSAYADAKATLFASLRDTALAILNVDDPAHDRMARDCRASVVGCSRNPNAGAQYTITPRDLSIHAIRADVQTPRATFQLTSPLIGAHNLMNLLQAAAILESFDVPAEALADALAAADPPPGRLEPVRPEGLNLPFALLVDYAHTDDALDNVLRAVRPFVKGTLHLVFGCGGDRDRSKRPRMGAVACRHADSVIVTSDNPRTEDPRAIIDDILTGVPADARPRLSIEPDREAAIDRAVQAAAPGDLVLIAGKGHENYQLLPANPASPNASGGGGIVRRDFDDRLVAADALRRRFDTAETGKTARARS